MIESNILSEYRTFISLASKVEIISNILHNNPIWLLIHWVYYDIVGVHYYVMIGECYTTLSESLHNKYNYTDENSISINCCQVQNAQEWYIE